MRVHVRNSRVVHAKPRCYQLRAELISRFLIRPGSQVSIEQHSGHICGCKDSFRGEAIEYERNDNSVLRLEEPADISKILCFLLVIGFEMKRLLYLAKEALD